MTATLLTGAERERGLQRFLAYPMYQSYRTRTDPRTPGVRAVPPLRRRRQAPSPARRRAMSSATRRGERMTMHTRGTLATRHRMYSISW